MDQVTLQISISKSLKIQAETAARKQGFPSLVDSVRTFVTQLAKRELKVSEEPSEYVKLSPRAKKRYKKMEQDFKFGRNIYTAKSIDEMIRQLDS